jgi:hypothetical protein
MSRTHPLDTALERYSITARTVLNLKSPVNRLGLSELTLYTAAAGSALALAPVAEASIIYSGVKNITLNRVANKTATTQVDLNNDGNDDIRLNIFSSAFSTLLNHTQPPPFQAQNAALLSASGLGAGARFLHGSSNNPYGPFDNGGALRLNASAADLNGQNNYNPPLNTVVAGNTNWDNLGFLRGILSNQNNTSSLHGFWNPGKTGTIDGFAGINFASNNFGWLQLKLTTVSNYTNSLTLVDWAYQSVPGASIHVGDTGSTTPSVPEPSTLGLMALGAAGIAVLRRRRNCEKNADQAH